MSKWSDLGNVLNVLREIDVNAVREESERELAIACIGKTHLSTLLSRLLREQNSQRYGPSAETPLLSFALPLKTHADDLRRVDLLVLILDGREPLSRSEKEAFLHLDSLALPFLVVVFGGNPAQKAKIDELQLPAAVGVVIIEDSNQADAVDVLAQGMLDRLPSELHIAAARRLPSLRTAVAKEMIRGASLSNASYVAATAIPQFIPIVSIPFAAADMLVLTKNQAFMVYRLALVFGAPPDFQARIGEVLPVVGGAYVWRQLARTLVGLIPIWGLVPKVAIAYAGTYTTGTIAWRWYEQGELISRDHITQISQEALAHGRKLAGELISQAREQGRRTPALLRRSWQHVVRLFQRTRNNASSPSSTNR